jgi:hypothetical protein
MADQIIAVSTYGAQRVTDPNSGKDISAYKMGYASAVTAVLLALYGAKARDVSPKQAHYRYVHVDGDVVVRHGYILLTLTADELVQAERVTRQHHRADVFLWRDKRWFALPDNTQSDYSEPGYRAGPNFDPTGFRPPSPLTGERESAVTGIIAQRSQRDAGGAVWWWLTGETYPHRDLLKRQGARFSSRRRAWYYIGAALPAAIRALITRDAQTDEDAPDNRLAPDTGAADVHFSDGEPCTVEEAAAILGMQAVAAPIPEPPPRLFGLHDSAYARHEPETAEGKPIPTGTRGTVVRLYSHNAKHGWSCDVDFDGIGICWAFERELTAHAPIPGIQMQGAVVPPGAVLPPTDAEIKRTLIDYGPPPTAYEISTESKGEPVSPPTEDQPSAIRIRKPAPLRTEGKLLDVVQTALRHVKAHPLTAPVTMPVSNGRIAPIKQSYVGELTGSITGQVFCYGFAVHEGVCVYLNMAGPRAAVEAIRAKLSKGEQISVVPPDAPVVELTAGEGNSGMYHPYLHYLPEARFASLILVHDWVVTPNYGGKAATFIVRTSEGQAVAKLKHHVTQLVHIPVFEAWSAFLYDAGQRAMLVRRTRSAGGIDLLSVDLDVDAWTRLITGGLEQKIIELP